MKKGKKIAGLLIVTALLCGDFSGFVNAQEDTDIISSIEEGNNTLAPVNETSVEPFALSSTDTIPINDQTFPDPAFRDYLIKTIKDTDSLLTKAEISNLDYVTINQDENKNIKSLKGIEYFTDMEVLNLKTPKLESLDLSKNLKTRHIDLLDLLSVESIELGNNTTLTYFNMSATGGSSEPLKMTKTIDFSGCLNLEKVRIRYNNIGSIDFSNNKKLKSIEFSSSNIKELNLANNTEITYLNCSENNLLEALDVSQCFKLTEIEARNNKSLKVMELGDITTITKLDLIGNPISKLDISKLTELTDLNIGFTNIRYLDNTNNTKLTNFRYTSMIPYVVPLDKSRTLDLRNFVPQDILDKVTTVSVNGTGKAYDGNPIIENIDPTKKMFIQVPLPGKVNGANVAISTYITPQGMNEWITPPSIGSWGVGDQAKTPFAESAFGNDTVTYEYSNAIDGTYVTDTPTVAGVYYVKAKVAEKKTTNYGMYEGLESNPVKFTINDWTSPLTIENWKYGDTPSTPKIDAVAGTDKVTFEYSKEKNGTYTNKVPTELGTWYIRAVLKPTSEYVGLKSDSISFTIDKNSNSWITMPSLKDWTLGITPNIPVAKARFGNENILFQYSNQENGVYSDTVPTKAGIWYMKAVIKGNEKYGDLEGITKFEIINPEITNGLSVTYTTGSANNATFTCSGLLEDLTNVYVDKKQLDSENYLLKSGSTILTLNYDYLDSLTPGKHILRFEYGSQFAEISFDVIKGEDSPVSKDNVKDSNSDNNKDKRKAPDTGDNTDIVLWASLFIIAGATFIISIAYKRININRK